MEFGKWTGQDQSGFSEFFFSFVIALPGLGWAGLFRGPVVRGFVGLNPACLQDEPCWKNRSGGTFDN
jgi:hypothetical protein